MNCQMAAWVISEDPAAQAALLAVETWMHTVEQALSRFRPDSDLSRLNASAGHPYPAGDVLWQVTQRALAAANATDGLFDPTIGQALIRAGYHRSFEHLSNDPQPPHDPIEPRPEATYTWRDIQLDPARRTITLPPGVRLDLGGIAKGWAAEQALAMLRPFGPAMVDAGGDLAIGDPPPNQEGWSVAIADPLSPEDDLVVLTLANRGLATSGTDHRRWRHRGRMQHHIVDPHQHQPAQTDILTATVIAPTATEADVLALVLVVMGLAHADVWLQQHEDIPTLLVLNDGRTYQNPTFTHYVQAYFPIYA